MDEQKYQLSAKLVEFRALQEGEENAGNVIGRVRGMAITDDVIESYGIRVLPGAFDDSLETFRQFPQLLHDHQWHRQIGMVSKIEGTPNGYMIEADIANTTLGRDIWTLISLRALRAFSVSFDPIETRYDRETEIEDIIRGVLKEISIVGRPAAQRATFDPIAASAERRARQRRQEAAQDEELMELASSLGVAVSALAALTLSGLPSKEE